MNDIAILEPIARKAQADTATGAKPSVVLAQHIVEVISDSGEGAQRCGQALGSIAARMGNGIWTVEIIPAEIQPPARSVAGASGNRIRIGAKRVTNGGDETVRLWDPVSGETVAREADTGVAGFAVFPDGLRVVSASPQALRVWPVDTRPLPPPDEDGLRRWMNQLTSARIEGDQLGSP